MPFFLSLLPFLHILSPVYNLCSERYLYLSLFFLIFGLSHLLFYLYSNPARSMAWHTATIVILFLVLCSLSTRAFFRTLDWKDSIALFTSAYKEAKQDLYKGLRLEMLGGVLTSYYKDNETQNKGNRFIFDGINILENSLTKLEEEKQKHQNKLPEVIKAYGLDPKTIQAKTAYLLTFTRLGMEGNIKNAYELLRPHMQDLSIIDTQILDLYLGLLFTTNNLNEAERLLNHALPKRPSPTIFIALATLEKRKYNNLQESEKFLQRSFKYFPYDIQTLSNLKGFYLELKRPNEYAFFSYLYGLRVHSKQSLEEAYKIFIGLNNQTMAKRALRNIRLLEKNRFSANPT